MKTLTGMIANVCTSLMLMSIGAGFSLMWLQEKIVVELPIISYAFNNIMFLTFVCFCGATGGTLISKAIRP